MRHSFASDNNSGLHPAILTALAEANQGHALGYGEDPWTRTMETAFAAELGPVAVFPVLTGTAANVLSISALLQPFEAVICGQQSHLWVDECGAPERFTGSKLLPVATPDGQLSPALIEPLLQGRGDEHRVQARLISITQPTEVGTVYSLAQMRELADFAHAHGLWLHVDGARISNAAVSLACDFHTLLRQTGVDLVSFGGTKNGLLNAEAVIFMQPEQARYMPWLRKQAMQLNSKMRFISVQLTAFLRQGLWRENARQANQMARLLGEQVFALPGIEPAWPVESNAVFARVPPALIGPLQQRFPFYVWDPSGPVVRWMCSYDTQPEQVSEFVQAIRELL